MKRPLTEKAPNQTFRKPQPRAATPATAAVHRAEHSQTVGVAKPSCCAEQRCELLRLERQCLEDRIRAFQDAVLRLELECETAVNTGDTRAQTHRESLMHKLRALDTSLGERMQTHRELREGLSASHAREKDLLEEETVVRYDAQHIRDVDIPVAESTLQTLQQTLENRKTSLACRREKLDQLHKTVETARSHASGLTAEASAVITAIEVNRKRSAKIRDEAMRQELERRTLFNEYEELKGTIRVYCRVKGGDAADGNGLAKFVYPPSAEVERQCIEVIQLRSNATSTGTRDMSSIYTFDRVFGRESSQTEIFAEFGNLVDSAVDGYKVCAFAYGQTGSGKTYTMEGTRADPGIIPRSIAKVFERISSLKEDQWEYTVTCTFVEIYNDCLRNLLEPSEAYHREFTEQGAAGRLRSKHDIVHVGRTDTTISGIKEHIVKCPADLLKLLAIATRNRFVAKTNVNERSSRSHCVFTMRITGTNRTLKQKSEGIMCLIDLAGSERVNESGVEGKELREAIAINRSLMHLGDCIASLGSNSVVSWRNSRLTFLLQNFLAGDGAKILMFVMVSDREEHVSETNNSLRFAAKVNATVVGSAGKRTSTLP